jgi:hypothetical protein
MLTYEEVKNPNWTNPKDDLEGPLHRIHEVL